MSLHITRLWPVTLVVRAIARAYLHFSKPPQADYAKIRELELLLGWNKPVEPRLSNPEQLQPYGFPRIAERAKLIDQQQVREKFAQEAAEVEPSLLAWAYEIAEDWTTEYLHQTLDSAHRKYQETGKKEFLDAAKAYGIVYHNRMIASCVEIGLPTTVTPKDLAQLRERTNLSSDAEGQCPNHTWTSQTTPSAARTPSSTPCACGRHWRP